MVEKFVPEVQQLIASPSDTVHNVKSVSNGDVRFPSGIRLPIFILSIVGKLESL